LQARAERSGLLGAPKMPQADLGLKGSFWMGTGEGVAVEACLAAADRIADGWLDIHALRGVDLGSPPRWNRDPKTGVEAPLAFGKTLDCGNPDLVGDIEYLRQPNRHAHVVTLAQAYALAGQRRHGDALAEHIESWIIACPYGRGANWSSALEAALRLANWSAAWQLIGGAGSALFARHASLRAAWLRSAYEHAHFIRGWLSLHAGEPCRLIAEAAGLFLGALTWPHWPQAREWRASAKRILEDAPRERPPPAALEPLLACLVAGRASREWFSADFEAHLEGLLDYVCSVMDAGGHVLLHGDSGELRSLLAAGAVLFHRGDFKLKAGPLDDRTRWLLGARADALYRDLDVEKTRLPVRQSFPESGTYVLGAELDAPGEIRLVATTGSLDFARCRQMGLLPAHPSLFRATALPLSDTTTRLEGVTLLRLGRLLNFLKALAADGEPLPQPAEFERSLPPDTDRRELGRRLAGWFLYDGRLRGVTPEGEVYAHPVDRGLAEGFAEILPTLRIYPPGDRRQDLG